ncbi:MAG: Gfo/Idh/MocA family oxidoreductase [Candidatus Diapherotrites archaeon]|nr:Gfo/Idh/MocA family oxidoreductase [Candidatus Diapherotrites archaeon]
METLKTAVIGTGNMGQHHVRVYSEISDLVGVADMNEARARQLAEKYGCSAYKDYNEMLGKEKPDCVTIAVPTAFHAKVGLEALKKANCLMEKPIAATVHEAEALIRASNSHKLMVGHIERFNPAVNYLKNHIEKNGQRLLGVDTMRLGIAPPANPTTGVILDLAIHDIDLVRYLSGEEATSCDVMTKSFGLTPFEDHAHIFIKTQNTASSVVANWATPRKIRHMYAALSDSFVYLNYITQEVIAYHKASGFDVLKEEGPMEHVKLEKQEPLRLELEEFLACVKEDRDPLTTGEDATKTLELALRIKGMS